MARADAGVMRRRRWPRQRRQGPLGPCRRRRGHRLIRITPASARATVAVAIDNAVSVRAAAAHAVVAVVPVLAVDADVSHCRSGWFEGNCVRVR